MGVSFRGRSIGGSEDLKQLYASALRSIARWLKGGSEGLNLSDGVPSLSRGVSRKTQLERSHGCRRLASGAAAF